MILTLAGQSAIISYEKFQMSSTGFEPITSAMPVQCFDQLTYEEHFANISFTHHSFHRNTLAQEIDLVTCEWLHSSVVQSTTLASKSPVEGTWNLSGAHMRQLQLSSKCEDLFFNSSLNHTSKKFLSLKNCSLFFLPSELGVLVISLLQGKDMAAMDSNGKFNVLRLFLLLIVTLKSTPKICVKYCVEGM